MKCPRDGQALVFVDGGSHMRDRCPECQGLLLDRDEVAGALGQRGRAGPALPPERVAALPDGGLVCPRDGTGMRRLDHRGVEIDLCPQCSSLWVDAGELEKIRSKKKGGSRKAAVAAGAAAAGAAVTAAAAADKPALVAGLAEAAGEVAVEGAIDLVFEFAIDAIGALFS